MSVKEYITLNDGNRMPVIGFGTYAPATCSSNMVERATELAIEAGYRHIDGAYMHNNEAEVGRAIQNKIADGTISREDLFYTGKLWNTFHDPDKVQEGLQKSLNALDLDCLDLFLIHSPMGFEPDDDIYPQNKDGTYLYSTTDLRETWEEMEKCKIKGLVKSIGVSNFNRRQLELILNKPGLKYKPVCNQVECHIYLNQTELLKFCKSKDIVLVAYSALGSNRDQELGIGMQCPVLLDDEKLNKVAGRINRTPAQVALRFLLQRGVAVLAKSFTEHRIRENLQVLNFELGKREMKSLTKRNKKYYYRYNNMSMFKDHPEYPFEDQY